MSRHSRYTGLRFNYNGETAPSLRRLVVDVSEEWFDDDEDGMGDYRQYSSYSAADEAWVESQPEVQKFVVPTTKRAAVYADACFAGLANDRPADTALALDSSSSSSSSQSDASDDEDCGEELSKSDDETSPHRVAVIDKTSVSREERRQRVAEARVRARAAEERRRAEMVELSSVLETLASCPWCPLLKVADMDPNAARALYARHAADHEDALVAAARDNNNNSSKGAEKNFVESAAVAAAVTPTCNRRPRRFRSDGSAIFELRDIPFDVWSVLALYLSPVDVVRLSYASATIAYTLEQLGCWDAAWKKLVVYVSWRPRVPTLDIRTISPEHILNVMAIGNIVPSKRLRLHDDVHPAGRAAPVDHRLTTFGTLPKHLNGARVEGNVSMTYHRYNRGESFATLASLDSGSGSGMAFPWTPFVSFRYACARLLADMWSRTLTSRRFAHSSVFLTENITSGRSYVIGDPAEKSFAAHHHKVEMHVRHLEIEAWRILFRTTVNPFAKVFAQLRANFAAGMSNIANLFLEHFDFAAAPPKLCALLGIPTTARDQQALASTIRLAALDSSASSEVDITMGLSFDEVRARFPPLDPSKSAHHAVEAVAKAFDECAGSAPGEGSGGVGGDGDQDLLRNAKVRISRETIEANAPVVVVKVVTNDDLHHQRDAQNRLVVEELTKRREAEAAARRKKQQAKKKRVMKQIRNVDVGDSQRTLTPYEAVKKRIRDLQREKYSRWGISMWKQ